MPGLEFSAEDQKVMVLALGRLNDHGAIWHMGTMQLKPEPETCWHNDAEKRIGGKNIGTRIGVCVGHSLNSQHPPQTGLELRVLGGARSRRHLHPQRM